MYSTIACPDLNLARMAILYHKKRKPVVQISNVADDTQSTLKAPNETVLAHYHSDHLVAGFGNRDTELP